MDICKIAVGANLQTAKYVNKQHQNINTGMKNLVHEAVLIGKVLAEVQVKAEHGAFLEWIEENITFDQRTGYKYISLFNYQKQISGASSINEAYKMIETLEAQKKQKETASAHQRVQEYKKTGNKPEGWRRGTDDKLFKEEEARDARIEAVKKESLNNEIKRAEQKQHKEKEKEYTDNIISFLDQSAKAQQKRSEFKEKIRLSSEGVTDPFNDAIIDYLNSLSDDNRRIEACYNIIKICKRIAVELQGKKR